VAAFVSRNARRFANLSLLVAVPVGFFEPQVPADLG